MHSQSSGDAVDRKFVEGEGSWVGGGRESAGGLGDSSKKEEPPPLTPII